MESVEKVSAFKFMFCFHTHPLAETIKASDLCRLLHSSARNWLTSTARPSVFNNKGGDGVSGEAVNKPNRFGSDSVQNLSNRWDAHQAATCLPRTRVLRGSIFLLGWRENPLDVSYNTLHGFVSQAAGAFFNFRAIEIAKTRKKRH